MEEIATRPAVFPFTAWNPKWLAPLARCFGPVAVYAPSRRDLPPDLVRADADGLVDLRVPVSGDEGELARQLAAYREWADLHAGADVDWLRLRGGRDWLRDATAPSALGNDLRRAVKGRETAAPDPLLTARLFLEMAQARDRQQEELQEEMARLQAMEEALFHQLRPDGHDARFSVPVPVAAEPDAGGFMTGERMAGWGRLWLADAPPRPRWFVTDSDHARQWVLDKAPEAVCLTGDTPLFLDPDNVDGGPGRTVNALVADALAGRPLDLADRLGPSPSSSHFAFWLYRIEDVEPRAVVNGWVAGGRKPALPDPAKEEGGHTVFAWIQPVTPPSADD